jgi:ABC-type transport system involved in cytochrome bd biosynthesis fused ATPase/permease subunit
MTARPPAAEIRRLVAAARPWLAGAVAIGLVQAMLLVAQAAILARLLAGGLYQGLPARTAAAGCLAIAGLAAAQAVAGWAWEATTEAAARRARAVTRQRGLAAAIGLAASGQSPAGEAGPGGLTTLLASGVDDLDPFTGRLLPRVVLALAVPALLLAWIGHLDLVSVGLAAAVLVVAPVLAGLVGADTAAAVRRRLASLERLGDRFDALVGGLPLLRAFGRAADHERAVAMSGEDVRAATLATLRLALLAGLVLEILAAVGTALVAVRLGLRLDSGQRILPQALAVLILTPEVFLPLRRLIADFHAGATGRAVLARVGCLAATPRPSPCGPARCADPGPVAVTVEAVTLVAGSRLVLDHIDLRVAAGERVCLDGESGAGKSSLLRVVAGLIPPTAGRVSLGPGGRRPALGWVPQHPTVLAATVLDNIGLGRPGAGEEVALAALEAVQLGEWLRALPQGLHTPLSGLDAPLSLGERRRLAMARSLAGPRPGLWLLDEPTAGLDRAGARRLVTELSRILDGATAIVATHDPSALPLGQRTAQLRDGRLADPRLGGPRLGGPRLRDGEGGPATAVTAR